ncbi:GTA-gp10 family protein [Caulobacter mirabilis]|uniref:Gene transfer agent family protein n=1 Tax=Caulobacter mirabilis TaxID=69666 RepID=A0A2D2AW05_9CAUL|nr:GTA-gp10 family protein [Caulobacter mirabilis]ATQ42137.1 hypothetical protein CSW64_06760 [Caulobacter mirabilis]
MTAVANGARGEAVATLGGRPRRLCLTLGALAELETAFGAADWQALAERLRSPSARDLAVVLAALLRGGGEEGVDVVALDAREAAEAVAAAFRAAAA